MRQPIRELRQERQQLTAVEFETLHADRIDVAFEKAGAIRVGNSLQGPGGSYMLTALTGRVVMSSARLTRRKLENLIPKALRPRYTQARWTQILALPHGCAGYNAPAGDILWRKGS